MKLNLLPTYVSKGKTSRSGLLLGIVILVACIGFASFLYTKAAADLDKSKEGVADAEAAAQKAKDISDLADKVITSPSSVGLLRNTNLAKAMLDHNPAYPKLYDDVKVNIPSFFRVNSMSAASTGPGTSTVTLVGVLDTYQQYADLMLALLRMPKVTSVSRAGYARNLPYVPAPTPEDQYGKPRKPGEAPIPDDPLKRLDYFESQGAVTGYLGAGGFGSGQPGLRGPMPTSQQITVTLTLARDLQTPDPRGTLASGGAASSGGSGGGPGATGGAAPGGGGRGAPPSPAPSAAGGGTTGGSEEDDTSISTKRKRG